MISGLADDGKDLGAGDTTPLFLVGLAAFRQAVGDPVFLEEAATKAMRWTAYQSPSDSVLVAQQPTTDWRDEQWVPGHGLYVNTLVYASLRLFAQDDRAALLKTAINELVASDDPRPPSEGQGLRLPHDPYYALWSFKLYHSRRFDLLGNSLALLSGVATRDRATSIVDWIESACVAMRDRGELSGGLPPNMFPFIRPEDHDWRARYEKFNRPGEYHNGGIWPFVCGFYVAALVAAGRQRLAERRLHALAELVRRAKNDKLGFGFNEWIRAQDGRLCGEDWQLWSASMYLYAARCVETGTTPLFDALRRWPG